MGNVVTNSKAAAVFQGIADLLEAKGENNFKIRAYRNAVRTLEELPEPVSEIAARGELRQVPGFGEAISGKLGEIMATGTCELYERLKGERMPQVTEANSQEGESEKDMPAPW
jgi:DNA polymerase (family 10)